MTLTSTIALAFAAYMIAAGLLGLFDRDRFRTIIEELRRSPALTYITGIFVYALGVAVVLVHDNWSDGLGIVVTLIGWAAVVEGLVLLARPGLLLEFAGKLVGSGGRQWISISALVLGGVLALIALMTA